MIEEKDEDDLKPEKKRKSLNTRHYLTMIIRDKREGGLGEGLIPEKLLRKNQKKRRFRSTQNLPRVDETKEENISPKAKTNLRHKLSKRFHFSDKFEDHLGGKRWLTEVYSSNFFGSQPHMLRSGSCVVRPIEEVLQFVEFE